MLHSSEGGIGLREVQERIRALYGSKDERRGPEATFLWFMQEVGELASEIRKPTGLNRDREFADVLAWLATLANVCGVDLAKAFEEKYGSGCPGCGLTTCRCDDAEKP